MHLKPSAMVTSLIDYRDELHYKYLLDLRLTVRQRIALTLLNMTLNLWRAPRYNKMDRQTEKALKEAKRLLRWYRG